MGLATFCELFAQLRETTAARCASRRESVNRMQLLMHRLNTFAPGSNDDRAHNVIRLTQIGLGYFLVVDAIKNGNDPVKPDLIAKRLANAEQMVQRNDAATLPHGAPGRTSKKRTLRKCTYCKKHDHVIAECWKKQREQQPPRNYVLKTERSPSGSPRHTLQIILSRPVEELQGLPTFKRPQINILRASLTALCTHTPSSRELSSTFWPQTQLRDHERH
jgi:hypothetical protein